MANVQNWTAFTNLVLLPLFKRALRAMRTIYVFGNRKKQIIHVLYNTCLKQCCGAGAVLFCWSRSYFRLRLRLQKIPYEWIFQHNLPKKQLKFPLSNNHSVQLAAVILPSNQKKNKKENF